MPGRRGGSRCTISFAAMLMEELEGKGQDEDMWNRRPRKTIVRSPRHQRQARFCLASYKRESQSSRHLSAKREKHELLAFAASIPCKNNKVVMEVVINEVERDSNRCTSVSEFSPRYQSTGRDVLRAHAGIARRGIQKQFMRALKVLRRFPKVSVPIDT
jgi:hypothetical protein